MLSKVFVSAMLICAVFADVRIASAGWDKDGINWCGQWEANWGSPTGNYVSKMFNTCSGQTGKASGTYNNGTMQGITYTFPSTAVRYKGTWKRTQGNSGGKCQYGQFYLDLFATKEKVDANGNPLSRFIGYWTYCNDDPEKSVKKWIWSGSEVR